MGKSKTRDWLLAVTGINEILLHATGGRLLRHDSLLLAYCHNVDFACFLGVLESQGKLAPVCTGTRSDLSLGESVFNLSDGELDHDFVTRESLGEMENFDSLSEDNYDPIGEDVQV